MPRQAFGVSPLLQELLPKATQQLASSLSNDDKEVLTYLIAYGLRVTHAVSATPSTCKSPWKPWKSSSKASRKEQAFSSWLFSDSCTESSVLGGEVPLKKFSCLLANHKASSTCDCFSCYSSFWRRWNASPDRDHINEILDVIEEGPKTSKAKKKKRAEKKRAALGAEASLGTPNRHNTTLKMTCSSCSNGEGLTDMLPSRVPDAIDKACVVLANVTDSMSHSSITTFDQAPKIDTHIRRTGRKKSMFRALKQKEEACVSVPTHPDAVLGLNEGLGALEVQDEALSVSAVDDDGANDMESEAFEVSEHSACETSEVGAAGISPVLSSTKNTPRLHRILKRRHNQVIPVDCEGLLDVEMEQEAANLIESTQGPMSPRAADVGLGGRGFLARVFPDKLGRVASRLWDFVSVRLHSHTVEYD